MDGDYKTSWSSSLFAGGHRDFVVLGNCLVTGNSSGKPDGRVYEHQPPQASC
jgi:hypothetical protein